MKNYGKVSLALLLALSCASGSALACSGAYVGKDVSEEGTIIIARSEDIGPSDYDKRHVVVPASDVAGRTLDDINGFSMPLPTHTFRYTSMMDYSTAGDGTYNAVCTNENGVSITGTVSASACALWKENDKLVREGGLREAVLPGAVAAQATSAKHGVDVLCGIVDTYGSAEGNVVMIADQDEAWIVEIYGGHEYAAMKMPADKVAVFGNQFMIEAVDPAATEGYVYSPKLFETIDALGLTVKDADGNYMLAQSVCDKGRSAGSNMRTWGGHMMLAPSSIEDNYVNETFYPLFYTPDEKVSALDVMDVFECRYEGTTEDMTIPGKETNRPIGISSTAQTHIVQVFPENPIATSTITWFALAGGEHSVFLPEYSAGITQVHEALAMDAPTFDEDSAYWTFKRIAGLTDSNRAVYGEGVQSFWDVQEEMMYKQMMAGMDAMNATVVADPAAGTEAINDLAYAMTQNTLDDADVLHTKLMQSFIRNAGLTAGRELYTFNSQSALSDMATAKGYTVAWNAATQQATLTKDANTVVITIGSKVAMVNGAEVEMTAAANFYNDKTFVPTALATLL